MRGWEHVTREQLAGMGRQEIKPAKRAKFGSQKVTIDGYQFDSKKEGERYVTLKLMQKAGAISDLRVHVELPLYGANHILVGHYEADFEYLEAGVIVREDVKGGKATRTRLYMLKRKLLKAQGIEIREV